MSESKTSSAFWKLSNERPFLSLQAKNLAVALIFLVSDYGAVMLASGTAFILREYVLTLVMPLQPFVPVPSAYTYLIVPLTYIFFLQFARLYQRRLPLWQQTQRIFKISVYAMVFVLCVMYFTETVKHISRPYVAFLWFFSFFYLAGSRYLWKKLMIQVGLWQIPVLLFGAGQTAQLLMRFLQDDSGLGYRIVGVVDDHKKTMSSSLAGVPVLGTFDEAAAIMQRCAIRHALIAAPGMSREKLADLIFQIQPFAKDITFVPDLRGIPVGDMELDTLLNEKIAMLRVRNNLAQDYNRQLKRCLDVVLTVVGLLLSWPLFLILAVLIYRDSPGPVFFAHRRIGCKGKEFECYKFRTMVTDAEEKLRQYLQVNPAAQKEWEQDFKLKEDPRITRLGAFLRRTSLDELPQLFNVLRGEMSLVGPRPIVQKEVVRYEKYIQDYFLVRPGLTGYWQVNGRNDVEYHERIQMDSWYVRNWTLWLDLVLLLKTIKVVLARKGAY